jgi:hypothetical protein
MKGWPTPARHHPITRRTVAELKAAIHRESFLTLRWAGPGQEQPFRYFQKRQQVLGSLALAMSKVPATNFRGVVHQIDALIMNRSICGHITQDFT